MDAQDYSFECQRRDELLELIKKAYFDLMQRELLIYEVDKKLERYVSLKNGQLDAQKAEVLLPPDELMLETEESIIVDTLIIGGIPWSDLKELVATDPDCLKSEWYTDLSKYEKEKLATLFDPEEDFEDINTQTHIPTEETPEESKETAK